MEQLLDNKLNEKFKEVIEKLDAKLEKGLERIENTLAGRVGLTGIRPQPSTATTTTVLPSASTISNAASSSSPSAVSVPATSILAASSAATPVAPVPAVSATPAAPMVAATTSSAATASSEPTRPALTRQRSTSGSNPRPIHRRRLSLDFSPDWIDQDRNTEEDQRDESQRRKLSLALNSPQNDGHEVNMVYRSIPIFILVHDPDY